VSPFALICLARSLAVMFSQIPTPRGTQRWVSVHAVGCLVRSVAVDTVW
jgi:hypothetical protein